MQGLEFWKWDFIWLTCPLICGWKMLSTQTSYIGWRKLHVAELGLKCWWIVCSHTMLMLKGINAKTNLQVVERCENLCMVMQRLRTPLVGFSILNIIVLPSHSFSVLYHQSLKICFLKVYHMFFFFSFLTVIFSLFLFLFRDAATVMLSGQIADGFATIFAGELVSWL